jgi:hypothetical protein
MKSIKELVYEKLEQAKVEVGDFYIRTTNGYPKDFIDVVEVLAISERDIAKIERTRIYVNSNKFTRMVEHTDVSFLNIEITDGHYVKVESQKSALTSVMQSLDNKSNAENNMKKLKKICKACF